MNNPFECPSCGYPDFTKCSCPVPQITELHPHTVKQDSGDDEDVYGMPLPPRE